MILTNVCDREKCTPGGEVKLRIQWKIIDVGIVYHSTTHHWGSTFAIRREVARSCI